MPRKPSSSYRRLAEANPDTFEAGLATALNNLSADLSGLGRREEALAVAEEAVSSYRRLAEANPDTHLPGLARALNQLGIWLAQLGRREEALVPAEEAVSIYRRLAEASPGTFEADFAKSLDNLGTTLSEPRSAGRGPNPTRKPWRFGDSWPRPTRTRTYQTSRCR